MRSTRGDEFGIALDLHAGPQRHMGHENESTRDGRPQQLDEKGGNESRGFHALHFRTDAF